MGLNRKNKLPFWAERCALRNAIHRCHNSKNQAYYNYGARGIRVQDDLRTPHGWQLLIDAIGPRPGLGYSLDRIDNNGNYTIEPMNLRWSTRKEQQANRRKSRKSCEDFGWGIGVSKPTSAKKGGRPSPLIPYEGKTQTLADWAKELRMKSVTIRHRLRRKLPLNKVFDPSTSRAGERYAPRGALLITPTIH